MRTRVLMFGIAFVLLTAMPVQAGLSVFDNADHLQFPTGLQQRHPSAKGANGGLISHARTLPSTAYRTLAAATALVGG